MTKKNHELLDETQRAALTRQLVEHTDEAEKLLRNPEELECFLEKLKVKLDEIPTIGEYLSYIPTLVELVRCYVKSEYMTIPYGVILIIVAALTYFLAPVDLIPDAIPVIGYEDDEFIIYIAICIAQTDIDLYKEWRDTNKK